MSVLARFFHLPLLGKELIEAAARPRTYWMRVIYGTLLFLLLGSLHAEFFRTHETHPLAVLGEGRGLFDTLVAFQFAGIALFLPALMCGRITEEKERASLELLLLTDLTPRGIVLQKYLAGLVPMLTFLLLGLPLGAVAYAFGGFPSRDLALAAWMLLLGCVQVGALAIWSSAFFRTTVGAFLGTYLLGLLFYSAPALVGALLDELGTKNLQWDLFFIHVPPAALDFARGRANPNVPLLASAWKTSAVICGTALAFLLLAPLHLRRSASSVPARRMQRLFAWLDRRATAANRLLGNVRLTRGARLLPERDPILWRERRRRLFGEPAHLIRVLLGVQIPVMVLAGILGRKTAMFEENFGLSIAAAVLGTFGVFALAANAANSFVTERVAQTFEVLLTTPLPAAEIVRQKARALRGFIVVIAVPLCSLFAYEGVLESIGPAHPVAQQLRALKPSWLYFTTAALTVLVYLPLVSWLSIWIGLAARTRVRAIMTALAVIVGWCVVPLIIFGAIFEIDEKDATSFLLFTSPLVIPAANEMSALHEFMKGAPWLPVLVNFTGYAAVLCLIRSHCLRNADAYLRR